MKEKEFRDQPLVAKLAVVMGLVGYVPKRGWNDFFRYKYVMEGDLVATIRPLLAAAGIMIIPNVVSEEWLQDVVSERSGKASMSKVLIEYTVTDGTSEIKFTIPGYGVDKSDKSVYKAMTGSMKYALMKLFEVETGDDPEREGPEKPEAPVEITHSDVSARKGGYAKKTTDYQLQRIAATMREKRMDRADLLAIIADLFGTELQVPEDKAEAQEIILQYLQSLDHDDAGLLLGRVDAWQENSDAEAPHT